MIKTLNEKFTLTEIYLLSRDYVKNILNLNEITFFGREEQTQL